MTDTEQRPTPSGGGRVAELEAEVARLRKAIAEHNTRIWQAAIDRGYIGSVSELGMIAVDGPGTYPILGITYSSTRTMRRLADALPEQRHGDGGGAEQQPEQRQQP